MEISVIIPVYNVEKYISRCIKSILSQTFNDFEIVVVNDASPDKSMQIVQEYAQNDARFVIVDNKQNMGLMWTRMVGYKNAKGKYLIFCDSDDYLPENALEILYNAINDTDISLVVSNAQYVSDNKKESIITNKLSFGNDTESIYKSLLTGELFHSVWGKIYNRNLFCNYEYETFEKQTNGEDGILFYQLVKNVNKLKLIDDITYYYYINPNSATRGEINDKKLQEILFASDYVSNYVKTNNPELSSYVFEREIKILLVLLRNRVLKNKVKRFSTQMNISKLSEFRTIYHFYKGKRFLSIYAFVNSKFVRYLFNKLFVYLFIISL